MIRFIGAALVVAASTGIGFRIAADYRHRPRQIRSLMHALRVLRTEIDFTLTPLPLALVRTAERADAPVAHFFTVCAEHLELGETPAEAVTAGVAELRGRSALRGPELEVLSALGGTLGNSDRQSQCQHIDAALMHLSHVEEEAREAQRRNERLWQYLGFLFGLLLVVLLY
ncbi:MAG: stage III sporulation protein AB [Thermoflavifilum sp.]|nr:stage III sporulation protein AB [Thermoflavifilum sp.]MCL6514003.1 stage III sporulation protein AB [Alicyclobacillus sp.]